MTLIRNRGGSIARWAANLVSAAKWLGGVSGSQIAELAIGLPFLTVLLVGIFDFGQAFNTKQKITEGATQVARYAANTSSLDLSKNEPDSIIAAKTVLVSFLQNVNLDTCKLENASAKPAGVEAWKYTSRGKCAENLVLTIERANLFKEGSVTVISTKVTVSYPFQWHFNNVMKILFPKSKYPGPIFHITSDAVIANLT